MRRGRTHGSLLTADTGGLIFVLLKSDCSCAAVFKRNNIKMYLPVTRLGGSIEMLQSIPGEAGRSW